jgi:hypothetical protein
MLPWSPSPTRERIALEGQALAAMNDVLLAARCRPFSALADLLRADASFLCTFPEIDHYGARDGGLYCGPVAAPFPGERALFPDVPGKRLFVYLSRDAWDLDAIMTQLGGLGLPTLAHIGGIDETEASGRGTATMRVSSRPFDMTSVLAECDLVASHSGHGTVASTLLAGRPMLLVPRHPEQRLLGERVVALGAGVLTGYEKGKKHDYAGATRRLLEEPGFARSALAFARRHAAFDRNKSISTIVERCAALLRRPVTTPKSS